MRRAQGSAEGKNDMPGGRGGIIVRKLFIGANRYTSRSEHPRAGDAAAVPAVRSSNGVKKICRVARR